MPPYEVDGSEARSRRGLVLSSAWVLASLLLMVLPVSLQQGISSVLRSTVLAPFLWTQESLNRTRIRAVEIEELQARYDSTVALLAAQSTLGAENTRLRGLLELRERTGPAFVSASAIRPGTRGSESMFLLDVGSEHGVSVNDPVVAAEGLVGLIREVGPRSSLALDWTHPDFAVSVMTLDAETFGIVEARGGAFREEDRLVLPGIPFYTTLEPGEVLVTSGQGAVYPRGIRVGTILSLAEAEAGWRRGYWVEPAVRVGSVTHVLVITGEEGRPVSDLTHLWADAEPEPDPDAEPEPEPGFEPGPVPDPGFEPDPVPDPGPDPERVTERLESAP
jgi:rod shape-determining protein MreC